MPQVDSKREQDKFTVLCDVMHIIAAAPSPDDCIPAILDIAQDMIETTGAFFLLFEKPRLLLVSNLDEDSIPSDEALKESASGLADGIQINPAILESINMGREGWLVAPIRVAQKDIGLLWLAAETSTELDESSLDTLNALVDGLTIVSMNVRSDSRHAQLTRNQSEFVRVVSHDLRSPLAAMKGFADMLESEMVGELNEKQGHFANKILSGIEQITGLVDNIQDAGRYDPETGFYELQRAPCDLGGIVRSIVNNYLVPAEKQELTLSSTIDDNVPIINADSNMLMRGLTNLVDNAIKYTPNGRDVDIRVYSENEHVIVSVKDSGLGISPDNQKNLFDRYIRIPRQEHQRIKGSGLGLFIVRSVATHHGGKAWVESAEGEGSTFSISIPLGGDNSLTSAT